MGNRSPIRLRPPESFAEGAKWLGVTVFCLLAGYAALAFILVLTGVWGGE
jgi:hypothetical protein